MEATKHRMSNALSKSHDSNTLGVAAHYDQAVRSEQGVNRWQDILRPPLAAASRRGIQNVLGMHPENVRAMQKSAVRFRKRAEELDIRREEAEIARTRTKGVMERLGIRARIKALSAERRYIQTIINAIDQSDGSVTTPFRLAMIGAMYGRHVGAIKKKAKEQEGQAGLEDQKKENKQAVEWAASLNNESHARLKLTR